jgi:hypothetical protein
MQHDELTLDSLSTALDRKISSYALEIVDEGLVSSAKVRFLSAVASDEKGESKLRFVLKQTQDSSVQLSKQLGLAREALFYSTLASALNPEDLPKIYLAQGSMETGRQMVLMEDLSFAVQSGYFFGAGNPMNWGKDLSVLTSRFPDLSAEVVTEEAFLLAARMHAAYWNSDRLLQYPWIRGSEWVRGEGRESWEAAQQGAAAAWQSALDAAAADGGDGSPLSADVVALVNASLRRASWERFREEAAARPHTLVHGDFHPGNMLWRPAPAAATHGAGRLVLIDWELVGAGSGPQDIAQYVISHMPPAARRAAEPGLVRAYHAALAAALAAAGPAAAGPGLSWEEC